jgi:kumamolisin
LDLAFKKAALKGISVFAGSGDWGAEGRPNGVETGKGDKYVVDYPSAAPYCTSVGGTSLTLDGGKIAGEVAWNNGEGSGATGGGISPDPVPDYQKDIKMPPNA